MAGGWYPAKISFRMSCQNFPEDRFPYPFAKPSNHEDHGNSAVHHEHNNNKRASKNVLHLLGLFFLTFTHFRCIETERVAKKHRKFSVVVKPPVADHYTFLYRKMILRT